MASRFTDKVAIITGASSGFGETIAYLMVQEGASLVLCGRNEEKLSQVMEECCKLNNNQRDRLLTVAGDLTSNLHRKEIIKSTIDKFGKLDILIPNAGISLPGNSLSNATEEVYDKTMDTNLKSVFFLIQEAADHLIKTKGSIVCVSSVSSTIPTTRLTVYAMSKAALDHMVRCVALSLGPQGVRINGVNPSFVPTGITRALPNPDMVAQMFAEREIPNHPLEGTRCGTREEVARAVLFLASSDASFTTGECIHVDGGRRFMSE